MHEVIFAAGFNKPKTFSVIEPLHRTFNFISHDNPFMSELFYCKHFHDKINTCILARSATLKLKNIHLNFFCNTNKDTFKSIKLSTISVGKSCTKRQNPSDDAQKT